jgi:hypothetical protein
MVKSMPTAMLPASDSSESASDFELSDLIDTSESRWTSSCSARVDGSEFRATTQSSDLREDKFVLLLTVSLTSEHTLQAELPGLGE